MKGKESCGDARRRQARPHSKFGSLDLGDGRLDHGELGIIRLDLSELNGGGLDLCELRWQRAGSQVETCTETSYRRRCAQGTTEVERGSTTDDIHMRDETVESSDGERVFFRSPPAVQKQWSGGGSTC
jgi:hypothetical protein